MATFFNCKRGFENDLVDELQAFGCDPKQLKFQKKHGWVLFRGGDDTMQALRVVDTVFASQISFCAQQVNQLSEDDRVTPLLEQLEVVYSNHGGDKVYRDLHVGHDEESGETGMGKFCQRFKEVFERKLKKAGFKKVFSKTPVPNIQIFFHSYNSAVIGLGLPRQSSQYEWGIPRLRMAHDAPSRSSLKLEEALLTLVTESERKKWIAEGMKAVDLGASPGGWTYVLLKHGMTITAIDNGSMEKKIMDTGMVEHIAEDAFKWEPRRPVDWMVCDVVEQPQRITKLIAKWLAKDWSQHVVVNFKLPMQRRWSFVAEILQTFSDCEHCRVRQLYHDRAEVTAFIKK